jgi:cytochrome P450
LWTANRDGSKYGRPHRFDITRQHDAQQLTFGAGVHSCLGSFVARVTMEEALGVLAELSFDR